MTTTYATLLLGYSLAGPLLQLIGPQWVYFICALMFLSATFFTRLLSNFDNREIKRISAGSLAVKIEDIWRRIKESVDYIVNDTSIRNPMIKLTVGWTMLGAFITLLPAYSKEVLDINPKLIGTVVVLPAGVGMLLAIIFLNQIKKMQHEKTINKGFLIASLALILFSFYHFYRLLPLSRELVFIFILIMGFGCSMIQIPAQTLLHLNSDASKRGSVFGFSTMQLRLATALPALIVGGISDLTSPLITMILLAITMFIYALILAFE
jgi:predicted MFS family arabinose efflux permease